MYCKPDSTPPIIKKTFPSQILPSSTRQDVTISRRPGTSDQHGQRPRGGQPLYEAADEDKNDRIAAQLRRWGRRKRTGSGRRSPAEGPHDLRPHIARSRKLLWNWDVRRGWIRSEGNRRTSCHRLIHHCSHRLHPLGQVVNL